MDKGLIKINELTQKLKELENQKLINNKEIEGLNQEYSATEEKMNNLENINSDLNAEKQLIKEAPKKLKKAKIAFIKSHVLANLCFAVLVLLIVVGNPEVTIAISKCLGVLSLGVFGVYSIAVPLKFISINKSIPTGNLAEIEKNISVSNTQLQFLRSKKQELNAEITNLTEINFGLESQIDEILKKINDINYLRTSVIEEFCNNNLELDKMLDDAYDKEKVKDKVK